MTAGSTVVVERDDEARQRAESGDSEEFLKITILPPVEGPPEEKPVPGGGGEEPEGEGEQPEPEQPAASEES
jgi:hypothetical protein